MTRVGSTFLAWVLWVALVAPGLRAQPYGPPTIHSVTLTPDTGVLTVRGTGLGSGLHVTLDGQPATVLPGGSDTQLEVQAPVSLLTVPGTYRLTVVDPVRQAWDGFIVASAPVPVVAGGIAVAAAGPDEPGGRDARRGTESGPAAMATPAAAVVPMAIIEDTVSRHRTAIGHQALTANTTGANNTAAGFQALRFNTTGGSNTALGFQTLWFNTTGGGNTAVGVEALEDNTTSIRNTGVGLRALASNTTGESNSAVGASALTANTTGQDNVAIGESALAAATSGSFNTAAGVNALWSVTTGTYNTAIGQWAGLNTSFGSHNIYLGALTSGSSGESHTIRLGVPYLAAGPLGQNATFIAGIRGTTVSGGEGVYVDADGRLGSGPVVPAANSVGSAQVIPDSLSAADLAAASVGTSEIADGAVTAAKVAFTFAGLGGNTFAGTQRIGGGNLELGPSTATTGNVIKGGAPFLTNPGFMNTFLGEAAGSLDVTGNTNTAVGGDALRTVGAGGANTASGYGALYSNVAGDSNTALGMQALFSATGSYNTAIGMNAGVGSTTGSHNVYVGANVAGVSADANTMRLGLPYNTVTGEGQNRTFIAGIADAVLSGPAMPVYVDASGQLGVAPPPQPMAPGGTVDGMRPASSLQQQLDEQRALIERLRDELATVRAAMVALSRRR